MTGTNCKNHWSWRLTSPSLALSTSCQSSLQITAPVHSPSVNSPSIYLISILYFFYLSCSFAPQYLYLHIHFCTSTIPVLHCYIVITSPPWQIYCLNSLILPHMHSLYIDFVFFFVLYVLFIPCVTLCCCMCWIALLYLGRVTVANENLFSTSLPV